MEIPAGPDVSATPLIVMVARGHEPVADAFSAPAVLGRTITTGDGTFEVSDDRMSRAHTRVAHERGQWVITDLESRNGTYVNGHRIAGELRRRGDLVLRVGHSVFVLLAQASGHPAPPDGALVVGPELARAYDNLRRVSPSGTLLVHAECGAGKEVAARYFHEAGPRRAGPFVSVSCPALPEGIAEKLLFGGRKGVVESIGHEQMAKGGTLFLDEVSALGHAAQARLLRLIEEQRDIAIVAGAHTELRLAVAESRFDAMLYKALARTTVHLPPLRDRKVDIARLVVCALRAIGPDVHAHAKLVEACLVRPWPGNVRELLSAVREAAARAEHRELVRAEDLAPGAGLRAGSLVGDTSVDRRTDTPPEGSMDKAAVEAALARANNVLHLAARALGIHRAQLFQLMDQHGIVFTDE